MPKKSFIDNPALQFISGAEDAEEKAAPIRAGGAFDAYKQKQEREAVRKPPRSDLTPAEPENGSQDRPPEGYKLNPKYIEKRSKRIQLVVQPSLYDKLKAAADAAGLSLNEYANQAFIDKLNIKE